jgi:Zn-finger nucleic acid-binding protein
MSCPRCSGKLHAETYDEVSVDRCDTCGGVWLDAGELEHLTGREGGGWFDRFRKK